MVADELQGIGPALRAERPFGRIDPDGQGSDFLARRQLPGGCQLGQTGRVDFNLARGCLQGVLYRIVAEGLHDNGFTLAQTRHLDDALLPEGVEVGHDVRMFLPSFFIAPAHPFFLRATFGVLVFNAEALGDLVFRQYYPVPSRCAVPTAAQRISAERP